MGNSAFMLQAMAAKFITLALYGALGTTAAGATASTELTGGSPAYARKPLTWSTPTTAIPSVSSATAAVFDVGSGNTVQTFMTFDASTAGNFINSAAITSQAFASQGTYSVTPTNNQS